MRCKSGKKFFTLPIHSHSILATVCSRLHRGSRWSNQYAHASRSFCLLARNAAGRRDARSRHHAGRRTRTRLQGFRIHAGLLDVQRTLASRRRAGTSPTKPAGTITPNRHRPLTQRPIPRFRKSAPHRPLPTDARHPVADHPARAHRWRCVQAPRRDCRRPQTSCALDDNAPR
jgi:hypothetical protein